jgi:hypothetical protein
VVSTVQPRREIDESTKLVATSEESTGRAKQMPAVVSHSGLIAVYIGCLVAWVGLFPSIAFADVLWLVDDPEPKFGLVAEANDEVVRFNESVDGVNFEAVEYQRSKVTALVVNVDFKRLESLSVDRISEYRDYAEELIPQAVDPVARRLAIRLLVIVAGNSDGKKVRKAAIASLVRLASTKEERQRWRLLEFLETGSNHSPSLEKLNQNRPRTSAADRNELVALLQSLRRGEKRSLANVKLSVRETANVWRETCSWEELEQIAKVNLLRDDQLQRLVNLEYEIRRVDQGDAMDGENGSNANSLKTNEEQTPWNELALRSEKRKIEFPTIENATEFDSRDYLFRNGRWQRPEGSRTSN